MTSRAIESETGRVVANVSVGPFRGFARDCTGAGERALEAAKKTVSERLMETLDGYFKKKERQLEVRIKQLPTLDEYRRAKALLAHWSGCRTSANGGARRTRCARAAATLLRSSTTPTI